MAYSPPDSFGSWRNKKSKLPSSLGTPHRITPIRSPILDLCAPGSHQSIYDSVIPGLNASMRTYRSRTPASSSSLSTGYLHSDWSQGDKKSGLRKSPINLQARTRQPMQAPELPSATNRMAQIEYDNFRDALYETSLKPNDMVSVQCHYYDNNKELQYCSKVHSVYLPIWEQPGFCYIYLLKPQMYMYFTWKAYPTLEEICEYNWSLRNTEV